jgi:hypothetical protein
MGTDKTLLLKGIKFFVITVGLMFTAPVILYQAFRNEGHPFFWPVLVLGIIMGAAAIGMGFYSVKVVMDAFFGKKN